MTSTQRTAIMTGLAELFRKNGRDHMADDDTIQVAGALWLDKYLRSEQNMQNHQQSRGVLHPKAHLRARLICASRSGENATKRDNPLSKQPTISAGARESVASHGLHRPTLERPGVRSPVTGGSRFTDNPARRPRPRDRTKRATQNDLLQRLAHDTGARQIEWGRSWRTLGRADRAQRHSRMPRVVLCVKAA